jgi:hypothetical protein
MTSWRESQGQWQTGTSPNWARLPFPTLRDAVVETAEDTQAPIKMVFHCAMNAVCTVTQGLGNYLYADGGKAPLSNFSVIGGETCEGKSRVDRNFFQVFYEFRESQGIAISRAAIDHRVRIKLWEMKRSVLENKIYAQVKNGESTDHQMMEELVEHEKLKPKRGKASVFIYEDTSLAALKRGLADFPYACVHSAEGMSIFNGPLFEEMNFLCALYSGDTYFSDRMNENIALPGRRLCVSAQVQPKRLIRFLAKMGDDFRDSGLAARMTFCLVESTQGYKTHDGIQFSTTARDRFNNRMRQLLKSSVRVANKSGFQPRGIKFDPSAQRAFLHYKNELERQIVPGGRFHNTKDYANRLAEKVARLSAAVHLFEDFEGHISIDTFLAARSVFEEESKDFMFLFNYVPSESYRADQLWNWLSQQQLNPGDIGWKKSYIEQRCLNQLRKKAALDPALSLLEQQGKIYQRLLNGTKYVCLGQWAQPVYVPVAFQQVSEQKRLGGSIFT